MPIFDVTVQELHYSTMRVTAEHSEAAIEQVLNGDGDEVDRGFVDALEPSTWSVKELRNYAVVSINEHKQQYLFVAYTSTLEEARDARQVSGDIVVHESGLLCGNIASESDWLWDWEKDDPECYARKMQDKAINIKGWEAIQR